MIEKFQELREECIRRKVPIISEDKARWILNRVTEKQPRRILELGTALGYSGCVLGSLAAELSPIELNPKAAEEAMINFAKYEINGKIIVGNAIDIVQDLASASRKFDLVFIDHALNQYLDILENCVNLTKTNGIMIADNINLQIQRRDRILDCKDFKKAILNHSQLETEIINIDDGLSYSRKL